jgi:hypothetical protein
LSHQAKVRTRSKRQTQGYSSIVPLAAEEADILRKAGYTVVSDLEEDTRVMVVGGNQPTPFMMGDESAHRKRRAEHDLAR